MEKDDRQNGSLEQVDGNREPQRAPRPAPGKVTRTSKLSSGRGELVQRKAAASTPAAASQPARSSGDFTMDPWMDASHRGVTALAERGHPKLLSARLAIQFEMRVAQVSTHSISRLIFPVRSTSTRLQVVGHSSNVGASSGPTL